MCEYPRQHHIPHLIQELRSAPGFFSDVAKELQRSSNNSDVPMWAATPVAIPTGAPMVAPKNP